MSLQCDNLSGELQDQWSSSNFFSHSKSMETIHPRGVAKFDPRGMNGTIYVEDH